MTATIGTDRFGSDHTMCSVSDVFNASGFDLVKSGPATAAMVFMGTRKKEGAAALAMVFSVFEMQVILPSKWALRAFVP